MSEDNYKIIMCDCGTEGIIIQHDIEDGEPFFSQIYMSFLEHGKHHDNRLVWSQRLRWIWQVLTTGRPYSDGIVLRPEKAKELVTDLVNRIELINEAQTKAKK
jgi:hypothetical protein